MPMTPRLVLKSGREKSLLRGHPWVFSGAVGQVVGNPGPGENVTICAASGQLIGTAAYSPASQIRARMWNFQPDEVVDETYVSDRVTKSAERRLRHASVTDSYRIIFSESDGLPGVIADKYLDCVVVQLGSVGADFWRETIADALFALAGVHCVYERSDLDVREREGLEPRIGLLRGDPAPDEIVISEHGFRYAVQIAQGHKTGFYLDQRHARHALAGIAKDRRVLNAFSYTGAFSVIAAASGAASVVSLDSSAPALAGERRNAELNGVAMGEQIEGNAFEELRRLRDRAQTFDLIVLDPPKLANTERHVDKATRAYKDLNLLATKLLAPGGILMTFSCSGGVSAELFQKVVAGAALDAKRNLRIIGHLNQPSDHPVLLNFPEAAYLKGLILEAD